VSLVRVRTAAGSSSRSMVDYCVSREVYGYSMVI